MGRKLERNLEPNITWRIVILMSMIHSTSTQWSDVSLSVITGRYVDTFRTI